MPGRDDPDAPTFPPEEPKSASELVSFDPPPDAPPSRYETLALLGRGAMGEVRRVRDRDLNRVVALKVLRSSLDDDARVRDRFVAEAQITAQLEHPGVIPVHEFGLLPDRRFFFTMKEVKGQTLRAAIDALHEPRSHPGQSAGGWTLARAIDAFRRVCEAVAYAHSRGVVHRDLKPDNIMIGEFGEVLVLDWGLSKALGHGFGGQDPVVSTRMPGGPMGTLPGTVAGTPYGVRGMAGNVSDLCLDAHVAAPRSDAQGLVLMPDPPADPTAPRVERGGSWMSNERACRLSGRRPVAPHARSPGRGFRLARSWPG